MKSYCGLYGLSFKLHYNIMIMRILPWLALMLVATFSFSIAATELQLGVTNSPSVGGFPNKIS